MTVTRSSTTNGGGRAAMRQRKARGAQKEQLEQRPPPAVGGARQSVLSQLTTPWLQFRYCIGFLMGFVACVGSILTYDKEDTRKEWRFTAWLLFALIGLYFHETRPFKRF